MDNRQALYSIEQGDEVRHYIAPSEYTIDDILKIASGNAPFSKLMDLGERIDLGKYAAIQQSDKFTCSVELNFDSKTANIYEVNDGKGGISEEDRTDENVRLSHFKISEYAHGFKLNEAIRATENKAEHIPRQQDISHNTLNADPTAIRGESRGKVMEQERKTVFEVSSMTKLEGDGTGAKAIATLAVNGEFVVNGVTVNEKQDGSGLYTRMPQEENNGKYKDLVFPITAEAREEINNVILGAYEQLAKSPEKTIQNEIAKPDKPVSKVFAQMGKVESENKSTIAAGQLTIDGCLVVKDVLLNKVAVNEKTADGQEQPNAEDGQKKMKLIVAMPNKPSARSSHDDIAHAITAEFRAKIEKAVIAAEKNIDRYEYKGVKYAELGDNPAKSDPLKSIYADKVMAELDKAGIAYQAKCDKEGSKTVVISVKADDKQSLKKIINELDQKGRGGSKKSLSDRIDRAKAQQPEKPAGQEQAKQPHKKPKEQAL